MSKVLKDKIRSRLIERYNQLFAKEQIDVAELRAMIVNILNDIVVRERIALSDDDKKVLVDELCDDVAGFGPIENIFKDPLVTEIMINGPKKIYVERGGKKALSKAAFDNEQHLMYLVYKILAPTRRRVDESYPFTDVSLPDGSRINIIIPPLALDGPVVTIRKFLKDIKTADDLIRLGTLDKRMADFLVACIRAKVNIIFTGATGSGKTTTLGALSSHISNDERIVTIEDTAELHLAQEHVVRLETRQPNIEGKGEVTIRDLFRNSLRMRPQRIILGEIRSVEALDMLQAICSGHTGSLAVLHANSPEDTIYRIETMIITSGLSIRLEAIHRQIASAINIIVQQEQLTDGSRVITHITQINGLKDTRVVLEDIFQYVMESIDESGRIKGKWKSTGTIPAFYSMFKKRNINLPVEIFNKD